MTGTTGLRLLHLGSKGEHAAHAGLVSLVFPHKTTVSSMQMTDGFGRPTYRKDIKV